MHGPFSPLLPPLARFRDAHAGQRMVIVCNGPSLNRMDLTPLAHEVVIGLNKIHLGLDRFGFQPRYLVAVNDRVIAQEARALAALPCVKFITDRAAHILPADARTYHLNSTRIATPFCHDITVAVREGHTVTFAALQIARYMGAAEVVIVGLDHRYTQTGAPNAPLHMAGPDPNHFDPRYFGGQDWDAPNLAKSEESFAIARAAYESEGRRIIDATLDGGCAVFDKVPFADLFGHPAAAGPAPLP
jgi:hypothetical protein